MRKRHFLLAAGLILLAPLAAWAQVDPAARTDDGAEIVPAHIEGGACPIVINGILGSGSLDWPSTSGDQTGRLNRNGVASTCAVPKACNQFDATPGRAYDAYVFTNGTGASACSIIEMDVITMAACNLQVNAYLNTYDPTNVCTGYAADPGLSSGIPPMNPVGPFEVTVPDGDDLIVVVHTTNPGEIGCEYQVRFSGDCVPVELQAFEVQ